MTDTEKLFPLRLAQTRADELALAFEKACVRVAVAGGIRRLRPAVARIELLAVPKIEKTRTENPAFLFDNGAAHSLEIEHNFLWTQLDGFIKTYLKKGDAVREFIWPIEELGESIPVRVTTTEKQNWGLAFMRATGSELFVKNIHGCLRKHSFVAKGGQVWHGFGPDLQPMSDPLSVLEEEDLFRLIKMKFVPAVDRSW